MGEVSAARAQRQLAPKVKYTPYKDKFDKMGVKG
jgi:hypothetical protein